MLYKAVVFRIDGELPSEAKLLMEDFRLAVNRAIRAGFQAKVSSRHARMWPRRMLHQYIEYKAAWRGVPVIKVDPYNSSRRCPTCGRIQYSRMGAQFECECGWRADKHVNAGVNLLQSAFPEGEAGGLWFSPGAFQHDVMMVLYDPETGARPEPNGTSRLAGVS